MSFLEVNNYMRTSINTILILQRQYKSSERLKTFLIPQVHKTDKPWKGPRPRWSPLYAWSSIYSVSSMPLWQGEAAPGNQWHICCGMQSDKPAWGGKIAWALCLARSQFPSWLCYFLSVRPCRNCFLDSTWFAED